MNITRLLFFFLLLPCLISSQNSWESSFDFEWTEVKDNNGISYIKSEFSTNIDAHQIPQLALSEPIIDGKISQFSWQNVQYSKIQSEYQWKAHFANIKNKDISAQVKINCSGNECNLNISIDPVIIKNGEFYILESIDFTAQLEEKVSLRTDYKDNSELSSGTIYEISVSKHGIYKLDKQFFTENGIPVENIDPQTIKVFGAGGGILPGPVSDKRIDDLIELPLLQQGLEDGTMSGNDRILFYAEGPQDINYKSEHLYSSANPFTFKTSYFIKTGGAPAKSISREESDIPEPDTVLSSGLAVEQLEEEERNMFHILAQYGSSGSGLQWYGDYFSGNQTRDYSFSARPVSGSEIKAKVRFIGRDQASQSLSVSLNGATENSQIGSVSDIFDSDNEGKIRVIDITALYNGGPLESTITYSGSSVADAALDYISINYQKNLEEIESYQLFSHHILLKEKENLSFLTPSNLDYWNITDFENVVKETYSNGKINVEGEENALVIGFNPNGEFQSPSYKGITDNQNLHSLGKSDMIIVSSEKLAEEAEVLAEHRRTFSGFKVHVVTIEDIAKEFGRGSKSPIALRDFVKMNYDRYPDFRYLLLFGDGTFDYRNIYNDANQEFYVPTFETWETGSYISSYATDDYFALLNNNEGNIYGSLGGALDVSVGRLPISSKEIASKYVDKIIRYDTSPESLGEWKLRTMFVADDEDGSGHMRQANSILDELLEDQPNYNGIKVLSDAFVQKTGAGGDQYPEATKKIIDNVFRGTSVINYLGHGSPKRWSQEKLLTMSDIDKFDNINRLPLIITATCTFAPFDNPYFLSAGERLLHNTNGGAIALYSTLRPVYKSSNERLVRAIMDELSNADPEDLQFGKVLINAKNNSSTGENGRKFVLLGDPSQRLSLPQNKVIIESINDSSLISFSDTLKALSKVKIKGYIANKDSLKIPDFNGEINLSFFDKPQEKENLMQDPGSTLLKFSTQESYIYNGRASVSNGEFTMEFIIPKDINLSVGNGKMSFYASDRSNLKEAMGNLRNIKVGGIQQEITDDKSPTIDLYLNDTLFVNGDIVNSSPTLLAHLEDDFGISVTGQGLGHDLVAFLDGEERNSIVLNEYYSTNLDNSAAGVVRYPLENIEPGKHSLTLRAWDVSNNVAEATIQFEVSEDGGLVINELKAFPNPFSENTRIRIKHNQINEPIELEYSIYNNVGQRITSEVLTYDSAPSVIQLNEWDGTSENGIKLSDGLYYLRINMRLKNQVDNVKSTKTKELKLLYFK